MSSDRDPQAQGGGGAPVSRRHISRGVAWIGLASTLVGVLDLAAQVIILHLFLSAEEYGIAAIAMALVPILNLAADLGGLASAVIQAEDHTPDEIATVFWLNVLISASLFGLVTLAAPIYASWQGHPVVGAMLVAHGAKNVAQNAYFIPSALMKRELRFKELSIIEMVGNVAEFAAKVGFAATGWMLWCFVLGDLAKVLVVSVAVQLRHPWLPRLHFRPREIGAYVRFGVLSSAGQLLYQLYTNADYIVVSKLFGATALGLYRAAYELVLGLVKTVAQVFSQISFATYARLREHRALLVEQFISFTRQNLVAVLPVVLVVFIAAEEALAVAWGPEYAAAATAARILCAVGLLRALSPVVPPLLEGIGRPSLSLAYHAVAATVLPALFIGAGVILGPRLGYVSVAIAWAAGYPIAVVVLLWLALDRIGLSPLTLLRRIIGIPACAALAAPFGVAAHLLTPGLAATPRLVIVAAVVLGVLAAALAKLQGITPRSIIDSMRARPPAATPPDDGTPPS
jgi:O-antigen/teichoic acid export membrane protein